MHISTYIPQVPTVPSTDNCIQWSGNGTVIIQVGDHGSMLEYAGIHTFMQICAQHRAPWSTMAAAVVTIIKRSPLI